jgi:alpha-D-ribose 1-methylphosphonate 5-triphosphate diphosphatase
VSNERVVFTNAQVVLADRVIAGGAVLIDHGVIAAIAETLLQLPETDAEEIDAEDALLIPGIVDLHNDSLETEINPRPGANLPLEFALGNLERRLASSGVTTEFHAISFMNMEKSNRTVAQAAERSGYISGQHAHPARMVEHHVLHRLDVWNPDAMDSLFDSVGRMHTGYVSLNDHTPGQGQYRDVARYTQFMQQWRQQRGGPESGEEEVQERMRSRGADASTIPSVYARVHAEREMRPFVLSTHDDDSPEKVDRQWEIGASIAEFPVTMDAAVRARERGMSIVVGAPNIVRGGSTSGNMDAVDLVAAGLADIICADYHAPSLLVAAFRLVEEGLLDLPAAIRMLTANPARAVGLHDRGSIEPGKRADLALVQLGASGTPMVEALYRRGHMVMAMQPPALVGGAAW